MSALSPSERLRQKLHLKKYLEELSALTGRHVQVTELGSLEQAAAMRLNAQKFVDQVPTACEIMFADRSSERFKEFLRRLKDANPSLIYVWTPRTINCGALLVSSLELIKFDFDFAINDEGVIAFITSDLNDSLLLDFSNTPTDELLMKVETKGSRWSKVAY